MSNIRLMCVLFLSLLAGWALPAAAQEEPKDKKKEIKFKASDLRLPDTTKITIVSCYGGKKSLFSRETAETLSREDIPTPIQEKTDVFVSNFSEAMVEAGFEVTTSTLPAGCRLNNDTAERITVVIGFTLIGQLGGVAEDYILADSWLKEPSGPYLVGVVRKLMNGVFSQRNEPKPSAREMAPIVVKRIRLAQQEAQTIAATVAAE